jgi:hypothetical protein
VEQAGKPVLENGARCEVNSFEILKSLKLGRFMRNPTTFGSSLR